MADHYDEDEESYMITPKGVLFLEYGNETSQKIVDTLKDFMVRLAGKEEEDVLAAIIIEDNQLVFRLVRKAPDDMEDFFDDNTIIQ